jgi:hypothetical protein
MSSVPIVGSGMRPRLQLEMEAGPGTVDWNQRRQQAGPRWQQAQRQDWVSLIAIHGSGVLDLRGLESAASEV